MNSMSPLLTTVSSKGQVILPKPIRDHRQWESGTRLIVEETPEGVLLRRVPEFEETDLDSVAGCLAYEGDPVSIEDMDKAIEDQSSTYDRD